LYVARLIHNWRGEWSAAVKRARESARVAADHGLPFWLGLATIGVGWALAGQGQTEHGIAEMQHGLEGYQRTGARVGFSQKLMALAEAYGKLGKSDEAGRALAEAHAFSETTGEEYCAAEVARLKGALLLGGARPVGPARHRRGKVNSTGSGQA